MTNSASTPSRSGRLQCPSALVVWIEPVFWREYSKEDVLQCASCGGSRKVTAFIRSGRLAREILERFKGRRHRSSHLHSSRSAALGRIRSISTCIRKDTGVDPQYPD